MPNFNRNIANFYHYSNVPCTYQQQNQKKDKRTIIKIPDKLRNVISIVLPKEKPNNTIGRPIVPFRKVLDDIMYFIRTRCQ